MQTELIFPEALQEAMKLIADPECTIRSNPITLPV